MSDDSNIRPTREEILERYGWQPGEKEQLEREMRERQARIDAEERQAVVAEERVRQQAERQRAPVAKPTYGELAAAEKYWKDYIRNQLNKNTQFVFDTIAKETARVVGNELNAEERARKHAVDDMKSHYTDICNRFNDHPTHDAVKALRTRIDELQERIDQLEAAAKTAPAQLRAVS